MDNEKLQKTSDAHTPRRLRQAQKVRLEDTKVYKKIHALQKENAALGRIAQEAYTDFLTQLPNRKKFFESFQKETCRAIVFDKSLPLILIDLDHFKECNDNEGHLAGDKCLQSVASVLRKEDTVARLGGDEFAVILPSGTTVKDSKTVADRLLEGIQNLDIRFEIKDKKASLFKNTSHSFKSFLGSLSSKCNSAITDSPSNSFLKRSALSFISAGSSEITQFLDNKGIGNVETQKISASIGVYHVNPTHWDQISKDLNIDKLKLRKAYENFDKGINSKEDENLIDEAEQIIGKNICPLIFGEADEIALYGAKKDRDCVQLVEKGRTRSPIVVPIRQPRQPQEPPRNPNNRSIVASRGR